MKKSKIIGVWWIKNRVPKKNLSAEKSKLFKIAWNGEKIGRKRVFDFFGPNPPKNLEGVQKNVVENEKNQSCWKLPEMARKLVKNNFYLFSPSPSFLWTKEYQSCSTIFKWSKVIFWFCASPPQPPKKNLVKTKRIIIVPKGIKWRKKDF